MELFITYLDRLISFDTIHQFPLPIYNKRLWKSLCKSDTSNNFIVDLFIPELSLAIEADYDSTHNKLYDIARDNYIKKIYKIDTMRVNNYKGICS